MINGFGEKMTKIIAMADTQGSIQGDIKKYVTEIAKGADIIIHAGDFGSDDFCRILDDMKNSHGVELIMVKGNNDDDDLSSIYSFPLSPENHKILGDIKIGLVHGNDFTGNGFESAITSAMDKAANFEIPNDPVRGVQLLVFGHIHYPFIANGKDRMLICPGSLTNPRNASAGSYAQIDINNDRIQAKILCPELQSDYQLNGWSKSKPNYQQGWQLCNKCQGLFFAGYVESKCKAGGKHTSTIGNNSLAYGLNAPGEPNWRLCKKCQGLFFEGNKKGNCPAGGNHNSTGSEEYALICDDPKAPGWDNWRRCNKCQGLFYAGTGNGVCPNGKQHEKGGSVNYKIYGVKPH